MAIKTFTDGSPLTASDTNEFLANGGLVYVTQGTVSAATSLSFTSIFTSDFNNYRVVFTPSARQSSGQNQINLRVRSGSTDLSTGNKYQWSRWFYSAGATGNSGSVAANEINISDSNTGFAAFVFDIYAPNVAQETFVTGQTSVQESAGPALFGIQFSAFVNDTTAYNGFSLICTGNYSGTARVYGYRQS